MTIGVVVIGRNEGERLKQCIRSLAASHLHLVYVDSASSDDSVAFVREQGFDVIELDMSIPFSAARARNEGFRYLLECYPETEYIQFVDGDCEVNDQWVQVAHDYLQKHPSLAAVCGRCRERYPEKTTYNYLCDLEWDTPVGPAAATGGIFMCRVTALLSVDGFNPQVIAGEEPEMCFRLRQQGWKLERIDAEMVLHDANMTTLTQWLKRTERSGHAYAQGFFLHGNSPERYCRNDLLRIVLWSLVIPLVIVFCVLLVGVTGLLLALVYPLKIVQITLQMIKHRGLETKIARVYATGLVLGKFAQLKGVLAFFMKRLRKKPLAIIEYKQ